MKISRIFFFFALTTVCSGQVVDHFSDGDFTTNPTWLGTTAQFKINSSNQLQLNATTGGVAYLSTAFATFTLANYEWQVYVKQSFASSSTNFGRVYLVSDQSDLSQPLNGYYLQFGEALNNDAIELFKQTGTTSVSVCRGTTGAIANAFALRIKVTCNNVGLWTLLVDYTGGTNFILDASGTDASINSSLYFGIRCTYTASNNTKFFYTDFYAGPTQTDTTPPTVSSVQVTSAHSLSILFSESMDQPSAEILSHYISNNSIGSPISASLQPDGKTVVLLFANTFQNGIENQLTISNVKDLVGNVITSAQFSFLFFQPNPLHPKDIIISEIFPDPSPQVQLPVQEYVEIYNRSNSPFDVSGWKFSDGASTAVFPCQIILPNQYWIVCASSNTNLFARYGNVIGVTNFPTLNNDGDGLTLRDPVNQTIDSIHYSLDWYHDADKQEGGWAIEIIDVNNRCGGTDNWTSSEDVSGGTPGRQNSVFASKPDLIGPELISVVALSPTQINFTFNETLEKDLSQIKLSFSPSVGVQKISFSNTALTQFSVQLTEVLQFRQLYTVRVSNLTDCNNNFIQSAFSELSFALPEPADSLDVVINEILFNPRSGGVDFVEVYNRSPKYVNFKNWKLSNYASGVPVNSTPITTADFTLPPAGYLAFTSDPASIVFQYPNVAQKFLFKTLLPSLPDKAGTIAIINDQGLTIDHFSYAEQMHSPFIKDNAGVSLERISFTEKTRDVNNWKSASATVGFATPGYSNSNARTDSKISDGAVFVEPEIFSPSILGQDFSKIHYQFNPSGKAANVKILDVDGRLIKTLANNETLGYEGFFRWDGDRDDGTRARVGYYVVWFEVYDADGALNLFRKRVVVGK